MHIQTLDYTNLGSDIRKRKNAFFVCLFVCKQTTNKRKRKNEKNEIYKRQTNEKNALFRLFKFFKINILKKNFV